MAVEGNHTALQREFQDLMKEVTVIAADFAATASDIDADATDIMHNAQMIAAKRVDRSTVSETQQVAKTLRGLQAQAKTGSAKALDAVRVIRAAHQQLKTTHDGIQEAFNRSPVDNKQLSAVDPTWVTPQ